MPTIKNLRTGNYRGSRKAYIKQLVAKHAMSKTKAKRYGRK